MIVAIGEVCCGGQGVCDGEVLEVVCLQGAGRGSRVATPTSQISNMIGCLMRH
jgi:hypothetical protein